MATKTKTKETNKVYDLVGRKPLAKFYYQGSHSHPIRRTVLIINETSTYITGYEFREGTTTRSPQEALHHIKTYRQSNIVCWGDYSRLLMTRKTIFKQPNKTTLERFPIVSLFADGVW